MRIGNHVLLWRALTGKGGGLGARIASGLHIHNHGGGGPHKSTVGGSVESVVDRLLQQTNLAGLVLAVDETHGMYKVVLVRWQREGRRRDSKEEDDKDENHTQTKKDDSNSGMTVRAARVALTNVVRAKKMPLLAGDELLDVVRVVMEPQKITTVTRRTKSLPPSSCSASRRSAPRRSCWQAAVLASTDAEKFCF